MFYFFVSTVTQKHCWYLPSGIRKAKEQLKGEDK